MKRTLAIEPLESKDLLTTIFVSTDADSGEGSLRDALNQATQNSDIDRIVVRPHVDSIEIHSPLVFNGLQKLNIRGNGVELIGSENLDFNDPVLDLKVQSDIRISNVEVVGGAEGIRVTVKNESFGGHFPVFPTGELNDENGETIRGVNSINLSEAADPTKVVLKSVTVRDSAGNGFKVLEQPFLTTYSGEPSLYLSNASLYVRVVDSEISNNGTLAAPSYGILVKEFGAGSVHLRVLNSTVSGNSRGAIGAFEYQEGSSKVFISDSQFVANGHPESNYEKAAINVTERGDGDSVFIGVRCRIEGTSGHAVLIGEGDDGEKLRRVVDMIFENNDGDDFHLVTRDNDRVVTFESDESLLSYDL